MVKFHPAIVPGCGITPSAVNFLFIKPGILRRSFIPWLQFFKKDFHPWQTDNRELIEEWKESIPVKN